MALQWLYLVIATSFFATIAVPIKEDNSGQCMASCPDKSKIIEKRVTDLKSDILNKLGLHEAPNVIGAPDPSAIKPLEKFYTKHELHEGAGGGYFESDRIQHQRVFIFPIRGQ